MFKGFFSLFNLSLVAVMILSAASASAQSVDPNLYSGLVWRNIGPLRGGRISAVSGAVGQPGVFYAGLPGGGVWKTTSAGVTWFPVMDGIKDADAVGAVAVAPSDPNVIYVGMGDMPTGGSINEGNGIYKSIDGGKTWEHLGLDNTKQIPSILVDPHNPDVVMVAAQGDYHKKSSDRGLYRSTDGGKTWTKTLYINDSIGVQKVFASYDQPNVVLATTDLHYLAPGANRFSMFRADGSTKLFKSTDEGLTWKQIDSSSLPQLAGRTCVSIAQHTNAQRMFLVQNSGLYRSDDGGDTWKQMDKEDRRVSNGQGGYNCGVYTNTKDPDIVYVFNTSSYISRDGGNTFTGFKGAPGGDDPQQFWLDPTDGDRMLMGMDQGATVTLDGGQNWSSWYNQSTAQIYHLGVDNGFPYWVYGTQQDTAAVSTSSRGNLGEITPLDWAPHAGFEFGFIVPDPRNTSISYASGPSGGIIKETKPSEQWSEIAPSEDPSLKLNSSRDQPLVFSETNPRELFAGYQCLMSTTDGGHHWTRLSPDLTIVPGSEPAKPAKNAPKSPFVSSNTAIDDPYDGDKDDGADAEEEAEGQGFFNVSVISVIAPSGVSDGVIWAGTSNGRIQVTRDHGKHWDDATIHALPDPTKAYIICLDASHQDPATAYAVVDYHDQGDYAPYIFRTRDFGHTWVKIVNGLPVDQVSGSFARFVRADTERQGLLFAGTESSMYVSFDDGDNWQPLTLNLPTTSFRDGVVHGNDLVVCTYGRGFWVLDDIEPLRELAPTMTKDAAFLFKPADAIRVRRNVGDDTPFPPEVPHALNPPDGAIIYYYLGSEAAGQATIDVSDSSGRVIRRFSSAPIPPMSEEPPNPDFWTFITKPMPTEVGTNRINWNLRWDSPSAFSHSWEINANPGLTPASPEGPLVPPGVYTVKLTVNGKSYEQAVKVVNDPRSPASDSDIRSEYELQVNLYDCINKAYDIYQRVANMRSQVMADQKQVNNPDLDKACEDFVTKLNAIGGQASFGRGFFRRGGNQTPTFAGLNRSMIGQLQSLDSGDMAPTDAMEKGVAESCANLKKVEASWADFNAKDVPALNAILAKNGLMPVAADLK